MKKSIATACVMLAACSGMPFAEPPADVITPLEQVCLRDPLDPEKWERLAAALAVEGERERAATMYLQAASLRKHDVRQDYATLKQAVDDSMPRTQVRRVNAALVEVLRLPGAATDVSAVMRLEISNGNGVAGAAARLARMLDAEGIKTVRLSNVRPFVEAQSRIEYQREQKSMAQKLGRRLGLPLQAASATSAYADMRIVLGHDTRYLK